MGAGTGGITVVYRPNTVRTIILTGHLITQPRKAIYRTKGNALPDVLSENSPDSEIFFDVSHINNKLNYWL
jgi:hypothetical protein